MTQTKNNKGNSAFLNYGIDLGTTNSCIAKADVDGTRIYQTRENMNTTRSAVLINRHGKRFTGLKAFNAQINDPENVALEFKRLMGTTDKKYFPAADEELTPEELSAEILKSLKSDVARVSGENITKAVVTVPAAFGTLQCEATYKAARLAGFDDVHLLQEPIAAAIAYGASSKTQGNNWMIFDFGGGTLDVAIVTTQNQRLTVLNNEGNNLLGGKDIDSLIVEKLLLPVIEEDYEIFDNDSDDYERLYRQLKLHAEEAKIELSNLEKTTVYIEGNNNIIDVFGDAIELEIALNRSDLENLIGEVVNMTIDIAASALKGSGLSAGALEKIILVGGSTQIPLVRERLIDKFSVELDYSIDPITVVAKGAAIYASVIETEVSTKAIQAKPGQLEVNLQYERVSSKPSTKIRGRFIGDEDVAEVVVEASDGTWSSGWFKLLDNDNKYFESDITLKKDCENEFIFRCRDSVGNELNITDSIFSIRHKADHLEIAKPLVTSSLCVEYVDKNGINRLEAIIPKNTPLPAYETYTFYTNKELRTSAPTDFIAVKLWEGEDHAEPEANIWVANNYIRVIDLPEHVRTLARGTEVVVSVHVDESRRITMNVQMPKHGMDSYSEDFYKPTPIDIDERFEQINVELKEYYDRLEHIRNNITRTDDQMIAAHDEMYNRVEDFDIKYNESVSYANRDKDVALKIIEQSKFLRKGLSVLEKKLLLNTQTYTIEKEAYETIERVDRLISEYCDNETKEEVDKVKLEIREAVEFKDVRGVRHGLKKIREKEVLVLHSQPNFWISIFQYLVDENGFIDPNEAIKWVAKGDKAIQNEDLDELREAVLNLLKLVEKDLEQVTQESIIDPGLNK